MTRKDYIRLAAALLRTRPNPADEPVLFSAWQRTVRAIARTLQEDNYHFRFATFYEACEYEPNISCQTSLFKEEAS